MRIHDYKPLSYGYDDTAYDDEYGDGGYEGYNERLKLQHDLLSFDEFEYYGHIISLEVIDADAPYEAGWGGYSQNDPNSRTKHMGRNWKVNGTTSPDTPPKLGLYTSNGASGYGGAISSGAPVDDGSGGKQKRDINDPDNYSYSGESVFWKWGGPVKYNKTTKRYEPRVPVPIEENFSCSLWIDGYSYLNEYGALYTKPDYLQRCVKLIIDKCKPKSNPPHLVDSRARYYASELIEKLIEVYNSGHPGMFLGGQIMFPEPAAGGNRHVSFAHKKPIDLPYFEEYTEEDSYDDYEVYSAFVQILPEIGKRFNIDIVNDLDSYDYSKVYTGSDTDYLEGEIIDSLEDEMNEDDLEYPYYQEEGIENKRTGGLPRHRVRDAEDMSWDHIKEWFDNLPAGTKSDITEGNWDEEYWLDPEYMELQPFPYDGYKRWIIEAYNMGGWYGGDVDENTGSIYNTIDDEEFDEDELDDLNVHKEIKELGDSSSDAEGELYEDIEDDIDEFEANYRHHEEDPDYQKKYNKLRKKIWKFKGAK